jgi:hypothetical protein
VLARSEVHWPAIAAGVVVARRLRRVVCWPAAPPRRAALLTLLAFLTLYGALSAQYLLWAVPLAAMWPDRG